MRDGMLGRYVTDGCGCGHLWCVVCQIDGVCVVGERVCSESCFFVDTSFRSVPLGRFVTI